MSVVIAIVVTNLCAVIYLHHPRGSHPDMDTWRGRGQQALSYTIADVVDNTCCKLSCAVGFGAASEICIFTQLVYMHHSISKAVHPAAPPLMSVSLFIPNASTCLCNGGCILIVL
jgi:hypothetical protein